MNDGPNYLAYVYVLGGVASTCAILAFLWKMLSTLVAIRISIGQKHPPEGLLGDVEDIKRSQNVIREKQTESEKQLAVIETGLAHRRQSDTHDERR